MDEGGLVSLVVLILLIVLHALIVLAYAALTNSRHSRLRDDVSPRMHITYQFSLLLVRFAIAAVTVVGLGDSLIDGLHTQSLPTYTLILLAVALVTLILGDLVPEAVGSANAETIARWVFYPMRVLIAAFAPVVTVSLTLSKGIASVFGGSSMVNIVTEEEIMTMLDASEKEGGIENEEKEMIVSVLEFGDRLVREVMVPRIDIAAADIETTVADALKLFMERGHSRIPVYEETIDNVKGLLYAKDLLSLWGKEPTKPIRDFLRKATFVPESKQADELLKELRASKVHMAIVVDEYGGTAGLVTFEDLIEEIIGDIQDEYDIHEEAEYVQHGPDNYTVDASISVNDFNDLLDVEISTDDSDTLGGFLFTQLGRVPEAGDRVEHENLMMRIETVEGRRIRKVRVIRKQPATEASESAPNNNVATQPQPLTD
ncbi:MAG: hemolysin family protein [Chloroflexota bacterium]